MLEISVAASIENDVPLEIDDLNWKEDGGSPDTPSTVNDSWPWEDQLSSSPQSPRRKSGNSAKIITFAHEEFPLERPPINCRMLYDTIPITGTTATTEQVEKNEPIYNFSCRIIMSALNYSSIRSKSCQTARSDGGDDQHEDILHVARPKNSLHSRLQPHAINPLPPTTDSNSSSPISMHKSVHQQPTTTVCNSNNFPSSPPTGSKQQDHKYRSISASFAVVSDIQGTKAPTTTTATRSPHVLSSLVSWLSSAGIRKIAPNNSNISIVPSSQQTVINNNPTNLGKINHPIPRTNHPVNTTSLDHVHKFTTPPRPSITTKHFMEISETAHTAATMHEVRAWSSNPRPHSTSSSQSGPPSPSNLLTVPIRVIPR